jgi:hypothetical protein
MFMHGWIAPMLRGVLICGLLCAGAQAHGPKWKLVDTHTAVDAGGNKYFVDTSNLRLTDNPIRVVVLVQYHDVQTLLGGSYEYRSSTRSSAFDCNHRRSALVAMAAYSGDRGTGQVVRTIDTGIGGSLTWGDIKQTSVDEAIFKFVCSRMR